MHANLGKEYKVPVEFDTVMFHMFDASFHSIYSLFNKILENLEVKGLCALGDFDTNLNEDYIGFYYHALRGCNLNIHSFIVHMEPWLKRLTTDLYIEVNKVKEKALGKLKKLAHNIEVPEEFGDLEEYNVEIEEDEEFWTLRINCIAEAFVCLPNVNRISKFVEQLFKKVGIK